MYISIPEFIESVYLPDTSAKGKMRHKVNSSSGLLLFWIQSFPSPRPAYRTKTKELNLPKYLHIAGRKED